MLNYLRIVWFVPPYEWKGNDYLSTGLGNDLAIGDAGENRISTNMSFPCIYQIYRSF